MSYYTATLAAVSHARQQDYINHAAACWPVFRRYGVQHMVETWGADLPAGKVTDMRRAVAASADETVVFSWLAWPDRASADAGWQRMANDSAMAGLPDMPFDGRRMIHGGFSRVLAHDRGGRPGWYQGFVLAVPTANRDAYVHLAEQMWPMFERHGALATVEAWGEDVPHGRVTDFHRATNAGDEEAIVFSWLAWPDRDTCDAASNAMHAQMADVDMDTLPFDGQRLILGGFEPIFDSARLP